MPWPIETIRLVNTNETRVMTVGYRENDDDATVTRDESEWVTGDTNIVEVNLAINYRISDPVAYALRHEPGEADYLLRKAAETALTQRVATMDIDEVLTTGRAELRKVVLAGVQSDMKRFDTGLEVLNANIKDLNPPNSLLVPFRDVQDAVKGVETWMQNADGASRRVLQEAESAASKLVQEAKSYRDELVTAAEAEAASFESLLAEYKKTPGVVREKLFFEGFARILDERDGPRKFHATEGGAPRIREVR